MKKKKFGFGFGFGFVFVFEFVFVCLCCVQCQGETGASKLERVMLSILLGSTSGLACALACACLVRLVVRWMRKAPLLKGPVVFSPEISPKSLQSALANQTQTQTLALIGGRYYKTVLDNGFTAAVKRLQIEPGQGRRIQRQLQMLAGLRHRHLMSLRAYVAAAEDSFCLVYDYVPTGSLEDAIRQQRQIGWDARLRIAVGIIKGLEHLHFGCAPRVLHYNLKPANVLLDADFEPRLGDYGFIDFAVRSSDAPEYYTEKSDVFSFGVILGMLLTGRDPNGLGMWLRQLVEAGDAREAVDKSLLGEEMEEDEMLMAVRIAAVCLSDVPADRPSSHELVPMLTQLHSF